MHLRLLPLPPLGGARRVGVHEPHLVSVGRLKTKAWRSVRGVMREPEELTRGLDWIVGLKREGGAAIRKGRRRPGLRSLLSWRGCESATTSRPPKG